MPLADHDIRAHFARRRDESEGNAFGHHRDQQRAGRMRLLGDRPQVVQMPVHIVRLHHDATRVLIDRGEQIVCASRRRRERDHRMIGHARHRLHRLAVVRMQISGEHRLLSFGYPVRHQHRFGGRGRAVVHRGVRHLHAGEQRHLRLKFEQVMQRALRDFGLIRCVGG